MTAAARPGRGHAPWSMTMKWKKWASGVALAALAAASPEAMAGSGALSKGEIMLELVKEKGSGVPRVSAKAVVDAPADEVWALLSDCRKTGALFDGVKDVKRHHHADATSVCSSTFSMPFPFSNLSSKMKYTRTTRGDVRTSSWRLVSGDFSRSTGSWKVEPYEGSTTRTLVRYTAHAEPDIPVPGWMQESGLKDSTMGAIRKLRKLAGR